MTMESLTLLGFWSLLVTVPVGVIPPPVAVALVQGITNRSMGPDRSSLPVG